MTRGWWGRTGREASRAAQNRDLAASEPETVPVDVPPADRLSGPQGAVLWICMTPAGGKSAWNTEAEANERAKESTGSCVYPVVVEERAG